MKRGTRAEIGRGRAALETLEELQAYYGPAYEELLY